MMSTPMFPKYGQKGSTGAQGEPGQIGGASFILYYKHKNKIEHKEL